MVSLLPAFRRRWNEWMLRYAACAMLFAAPLVAQPSPTLTPPTLTPKEIDEAIQWGLTGAPTPYVLHHEDGRPGSGVNSDIVGAIYTPFLRIALAARAARDQREDFTPADIQSAWIEPVVYVAFRWYCCVDPDHGNDLAAWDPSRPPVDYKIAVPGDRVTRSNARLRVTASPLWVTRDTSVVTSFGGALPYKDVVLIAGYPVGVLATSPDLVIYREWPSATFPSGKDMGLIAGRVTPSDSAHWR